MGTGPAAATADAEACRGRRARRAALVSLRSWWRTAWWQTDAETHVTNRGRDRVATPASVSQPLHPASLPFRRRFGCCHRPPCSVRPLAICSALESQAADWSSRCEASAGDGAGAGKGCRHLKTHHHRVQQRWLRRLLSFYPSEQKLRRPSQPLARALHLPSCRCVPILARPPGPQSERRQPKCAAHVGGQAARAAARAVAPSDPQLRHARCRRPALVALAVVIRGMAIRRRRCKVVTRSRHPRQQSRQQTCSHGMQRRSERADADASPDCTSGRIR